MSAKSISRRRFLKIAGITLGTSTLACCGLSLAVTGNAQRQQSPKIETPAYTFGSDDDDQRLLVAYATRTGSTVGVAAAVGEELARRGYAVDVKPICAKPSLDGYAKIVLGSAVNGGKWLPEAVEFAQTYQERLRQIPVALFCVHIMNLGADDESRKKRLAYLDGVREQIAPVTEMYFAGLGMDANEPSLIVRWAYRTFKVGPEGDCRDWGKIRGWGQNVFA